MPAEVVPGAGPMPRRARHLIPTQLPRRGEVIAACAVLVLLAHLLFAQLTLVLAATFDIVSKASRWRRWWLLIPAAGGLAWTLAVGPRVAGSGFVAGPAQILSYLGGGPLDRLWQPRGAFAGAGSWLPRQLPLALVAGAAEAAVASWLAWMHTDEWAVPSPRPGALAAIRRALNRRAIHAGGVLTRGGCVLGVAPETGARVVLGWREAAGGVLVTGASANIAAITSFQVVHAALRRRKPVIVVDLTSDPAVAQAMAAACEATATPLWVPGTADGYYEPFRHAGQSRRLAMTLAALGIGEQADPSAASVRRYLRAAFDLMDAVPGDPRTPVIDDVLHLLNPRALQARFGLVPAAGPRRGQLAELVRASVHEANADPRAIQAIAGQLAALRQAAGGPAANGAAAGAFDLMRVVRERSAVLFGADAAGLARLVSADIAAVCEDLRRIGVDGDGLVWLHGLGPLDAGTLAGLVADGAAAGLPLLITATSPPAAEIATIVNAVVIHGLTDGAAAASLAARTGTRMAPAASADLPELVPGPAVPAQAMLSLAPAQFVLTVSSPAYRLVRLGQLVPARPPSGAGR